MTREEDVSKVVSDNGIRATTVYLHTHLHDLPDSIYHKIPQEHHEHPSPRKSMKRLCLAKPNLHPHP
ncbi:hypothetical protein, partial [Mucilaginibacter sp.]|uniref:hypothetical protein n=1 Tax=Mucilaginibacter sp. TaxID=1882438 RepID=UPI003D0C3658